MVSCPLHLALSSTNAAALFMGGTALAGGCLCLTLWWFLQSAKNRRRENRQQYLELEAARLRSVESQKNLAREQAVLEQVLAAVPQGVFWKDPSGAILGCNDAFVDLLGYANPNHLGNAGKPQGGSSWAEQQLAGFSSEDLRIMETGQPIVDQEEKIIRADGSTLTILVNKTPLHDPDGSVYGVLGTTNDITQRKQLERQLAHTHKMESIGQLAAGVAHEINTPTQFVSENMRFLDDAVKKLQRLINAHEKMLSSESPALNWEQRVEELFTLKQDIDFDFVNEEAPRAITESLEGLDRIRDIVTAMRDFSHPGSTSAQLFDLNRVIHTSTTVCRNKWKYTAQIKFELDDELPPVYGHAGELGQVIVNLIANAADAIEAHRPPEVGMDPTGRIRLVTRLVGDWIEIHVSDNGPGIPAEIRDRVFDPFFTTKTVGHGTGQGLSMTRNVVVTKHHGQIDLQENKSGGAIFILRLPAQPPQLDANDAGDVKNPSAAATDTNVAA